MRMFRKSADGFTLLELLFSLLIMGIALALGAAYFRPRTSELEKTANSLSNILSRARVEAMLSRKRTAVEFTGYKIRLLTADGKKIEIMSLPPDVGVQINGKNLMLDKPVQISFGPLGYTAEHIIYLASPQDHWSIYAPSLSSPLARRGQLSPEEIRKEQQ